MSRNRLVRPSLPSALLMTAFLAAAPAGAQEPKPEHPIIVPEPSAPAPLPGAAGLSAAGIVAVVNGDVISRGDVDNRRKLFALSTGLPLSPDVLARLTPQITRQLIDERLRLQEIQRRRVVVNDQEIAKSIEQVEARNGMTPGALRQKLAADGVELRTLVDQIRVQIGWGRVLRDVLGPQAQVSAADLTERENLLKQEVGQPEFHVSEVFVPIETPQAAEESRKFADVVIQELREGAPFPVVAAQFSQSQTALQGGDLGWVQPNQLDSEVLRVLEQMPVGAVSNPLRVPGGLSVVTLRAKREIGRDVQDVLSIRQAFVPFATRLNPQAPTEQQRQALDQARKLSASAKNCDAIEAADTQFGSGRPSDPGPVQMEGVAPAMRNVLEKLVPGTPSQPLVAEDGIAVIMVCSKETKNAGLPSKAELTERILNDRVELASRQLLRDLKRRAMIEQRA